MTLQHPNESEVPYETLIHPIVSTQSRQAARSGGKTREAGAGMGLGVPRSCGFDSRISNSAAVFFAECPAGSRENGVSDKRRRHRPDCRGG